MNHKLVAVDIENRRGVEPALTSDACWDAAVQGIITQLDTRVETDQVRIAADLQRAFYASERDRQSTGMVARFTR